MSAATINATGLFAALDETTSELLELITSVAQPKINTIPFKDSWTAAQLAVHVTKSNRAIAQGLNMEGKPAERNIDEGVPKLKKMFLDFDIKYKSPQFIVPEEKDYNKEEIVEALKKSIERLQIIRDEIDLSEIISLPPFGEVTKLELLHFVLYHTKRHVHQLKNIIHVLQSNVLCY
jgi:DinB superfamily